MAITDHQKIFILQSISFLSLSFASLFFYDVLINDSPYEALM